MQTVASPYHAGQIAKILSLPPVYAADLKQAADPSLAYQSTLQAGALRSVSFLDPDKTQTLGIFRELTQSILAGGADEEGAYDRANGNLEFLLNRLNQSLNSGVQTTVTVPTGN